VLRTEPAQLICTLDPLLTSRVLSSCRITLRRWAAHAENDLSECARKAARRAFNCCDARLVSFACWARFRTLSMIRFDLFSGSPKPAQSLVADRLRCGHGMQLSFSRRASDRIRTDAWDCSDTAFIISILYWLYSSQISSMHEDRPMFMINQSHKGSNHSARSTACAALRLGRSGLTNPSEATTKRTSYHDGG